MEFLSGNNRAKEAFELGIEALRILGVEFPADPQAEPLAEMLIDLNARLQRESLAIFSMPHLQDQDPELGAITQILPDLLVAAYICNPRLGPLVVVRYLELCLERRLLPASFPPMLASLALYICGGSELWSLGVVNETKDAAKHAQVAARLADGEHFVAFRCSVICMNDYYISFWDGHLRETLHNLERAIQVGHDTGCNDWAGYSSNGWVRHALYASVDPDSVRNRAGELLVFIDSLHYDTQSRWTRAPAAAAQALSGHSLSRGASWRSDLFDDERDLPEMQRSGDGIGLFITYSAKAWTAVLFGDNDGVEKYTELACSYLQAGPGMLERAIVSFVCGLRRARELRENPLGPGGEQTLEEHIGQLRRWADKAPMNFAHKLWLVQAEVHRSRGEVVQAMQAYEKASQGARENDYLNEAGLAHALAAEFFQDLGLSQAALHNAEQAAQAWRSWGAEALVEKLRERWPELSLPAVSTREATGSSGVSQRAMDLSTVVKASQALAGEIVLARLLAKMLQIVIENAGATRGYLLLKKKERWIIEAVGDVDETDVEVLQSIDVEDQEQVSTRIVNYVARSAKVVSLDDAVGEGGFADDPTVLATKAKSILCLPLVNQGRTSAILYLENNLTTGAFTSEGVELLQLLSSQMAMALDNARLYCDLEGSETRFRSLVEHANEAIVVAQDEAVKYCNPQFSALTGYALEEIVSGQFTEFVHPVDRDRVMREYRARMSGERPASEYSIRIITKDGREKHIRVSSALIDWDGRPATLAMLGDVTEQKEAEEQISAYQERLRALAAELTLTEERERRRIATELHDGPAQSLTVARLQLASAVKSVGDEKASAKLSEMSLNLKESLRQIREVLLDLSSNTLNEIGLSAALSEWLEEQAGKRHGLQTAFVDEAGIVPLDDNVRALLYRHARELIMNAIKHAEAKKVSVHMVASEQTLRITVEDDGRGFDQDGTTRQPSGEGGFGLFSIRERMADMGGSIEIESKPGEGCKATLTVPLGSN